MQKYLKKIIQIFIEDNITEENSEINWSNIGYMIGAISLIGLSIYLYSNGWFDTGSINNIGHIRQLDEIGEMIYKLSTEISKSCTVRSWETIHKVLKELDTSGDKTFNKKEIIISELNELIQLNIKYPGQFSRNSECFEKSLIKFIRFLKEIL